MVTIDSDRPEIPSEVEEFLALCEWLKPENIMLRDDGFAKVLDFGLAKLSDASAKTAEPTDATRPQVNTAPGAVMGTADYMSPEQGRGDRVDGRGDLYALGVVLFELLTGHLPYIDDTPTRVVLRHLNDPVPDPIPSISGSSSMPFYCPPDLRHHLSSE